MMHAIDSQMAALVNVVLMVPRWRSSQQMKPMLTKARVVNADTTTAQRRPLFGMHCAVERDKGEPGKRQAIRHEFQGERVLGIQAGGVKRPVSKGPPLPRGKRQGRDAEDAQLENVQDQHAPGRTDDKDEQKYYQRNIKHGQFHPQDTRWPEQAEVRAEVDDAGNRQDAGGDEDQAAAQQGGKVGGKRFVGPLAAADMQDFFHRESLAS